MMWVTASARVSMYLLSLNDNDPKATDVNLPRQYSQDFPQPSLIVLIFTLIGTAISLTHFYASVLACVCMHVCFDVLVNVCPFAWVLEVVGPTYQCSLLHMSIYQTRSKLTVKLCK